MILGIQILGIVFGLLMTYLIFLHYKRKEFGKLQFFFWQIIWIVFILVVLFPRITTGLIHKLGVVRTMDLLTILGFMFITLLVFYNYFTINKIKKKLEHNTRKEALKNINKHSPVSHHSQEPNL